MLCIGAIGAMTKSTTTAVAGVAAAEAVDRRAAVILTQPVAAIQMTVINLSQVAVHLAAKSLADRNQRVVPGTIKRMIPIASEVRQDAP